MGRKCCSFEQGGTDGETEASQLRAFGLMWNPELCELIGFFSRAKVLFLNPEPSPETGVTGKHRS